MAATVWLAERPIPWAYRRADFHAISESTRDDLVARGVPRERIRVIHPGVDAQEFCPDPAVPRTDAAVVPLRGPAASATRGWSLAIRALAVARRTRPELSLDVAGTGDDRARLEALAAELGQGDAVRFHGFVTEAHKLATAAQHLGQSLPFAEGGVGHHRRGGGRVRHAVAGVRQPRAPGFGAPRRDRLPGPARRSRRRWRRECSNWPPIPRLVARMGLAGRRFAESLSWDRAASLTESHLQELAGR